MDSFDEAPRRTKPRSTFRVLAGLSLAFLVALLGVVSCVGLYVGSAPKPTIEIFRTELAYDLPKFYPVTTFGAYGTQTHGVWVTLHRDGTATAFLSKDPLSGCFVSWRDQLTQFSNLYRDACTGSTYSPTGDGLAGPTPRGLDRYPTDVTDKTVSVHLSQASRGPDRIAGPAHATPAG